LQEGWKLLQGVSRVKLDASPANASSNTIDKLDAWENRWFPIAMATLERRFPAVHAQVFKNLSQTSGPAVAVSVGTFIERFDEMAAGAGAYGAEGVAAATVLAARGLSAAVIAEARGLLDTVGKIAVEPNVASLDEDQEALAKAEVALWAWYLEWSQIARIAVTQRSLLKQMGFIATHTKSDDSDVVVDGSGIIVPAPPANSVSPHN